DPARHRPPGPAHCVTTARGAHSRGEGWPTDGVVQCTVQLVGVGLGDTGDDTAPADGRDRLGGAGDVGREPFAGRPPGPDAAGELALEVVDAVAAAGGHADDRDVAHATGLHDAPHVLDGALALLERDAVDLVQHDE